MSLAPKLDKIVETILTLDTHIAMFAETWFKESIPNEAIDISNNQLLRRDRVHKLHGDVCLYVKSSIFCRQLLDMQSESVEVLWALLRPHRLPRGFHQLIVGVVYHPPGEDNDRMISYIRNSLESFESSFPNSAIIIAGDFNKLKLKQTAKLFQLKSMVNFPTRGTNTLDQIFSNLSKYYNPPSSAPPFGLSDHVTIKVIPKDRVDSCKSQPKVIKVRDKRQSKKASLGRFLMEVPWSRMLSNELTCDQNIEIMTDIINYGLNTIMPQRSLRVHYNERPWMTSNLKTLISRRQKAFASGNSVLFKVLRNKVNRERKSIRKTYYKSKVENLRNVKPSKWWQEVKHLCGNHKTNARNLKDILSTELDYDEEVLCEKINESFISVMHDYSPLSPDVYVSMDMNEKFIEVEEIEVVKKLRKISCSKAGGPDGLPNWILKDYADILAQPITLILNVSFQNSQVPKLWKIADVVPLPKASTIKEFTRDLRPISLTSSLSKIAEEFVIEKDLKPVLLRFVDQNQYGFIPRSSTTHALISMIHHWLQMTDGKAVAVRAAFLDFKKAFDMIDHNVLIAKLLSLGVKSSTINWLIDFLRDRQQRIKLNNQCFSGWKSVPAGVPQGTCLGPWLFLAMINDLGSSGKTDSLMWKFADDTTTSELILQDQESHLQQEINHIARWSMENKLILNPKKCKEMTVCFRKTIPTFKAIEVDNQSFERVQKIKILGLTMRNDLKWNDHINDITKKAAKRLYFIKQLKRADVGTKDLVCYYCAIIRSILEYSCQVFHSGLPKYLSDELERVQKRAMGIIFPGIKYDDALAKANIPTLFDRRESLCRKFFNEIVNDKDHKLANLLPERTNGINNQLRTNRTFHTIKCYTNRFKNSFMLNYSNRHIS